MVLHKITNNFFKIFQNCTKYYYFVARKSIYLESQHEEALGRLHQLENPPYQKSSAPDDVVTQAPVFTQPIKDVHVAESQAAHFEGRLIPVGDDKLKVEWLRNGVPIQACKFYFSHSLAVMANLEIIWLKNNIHHFWGLGGEMETT